jgi:hypothetical protein
MSGEPFLSALAARFSRRQGLVSVIGEVLHGTQSNRQRRDTGPACRDDHPDMDVIAGLINRLYVEHQARFRCLDPARVDAGARAATTGLLEAAVVRYQGLITRPGSARPMISSRWSP